MKILALDPGESTGWVYGTIGGVTEGGTVPKDHTKIAELIEVADPDVIVLERFNLFPSKAKALSWNSFYPVEVIGVIKYLAALYRIEVVEQAPSIKKYAGESGEDWGKLMRERDTTNHTFDAYLHFIYYVRKLRVNKC